MDQLSPQSPTKDSEEANRDEIVSSIAPFLAPEILSYLSTISSGYNSSVSKLNNQLEMKRRVENILSQRELPFYPNHNWTTTYNLLMTEREALHYSNKVDQMIAHELAVPISRTAEELKKKIEKASINGWTDAFKVLLVYLDASNRLREEDYQIFISNALIHRNLGILDVPKVITEIKNINEVGLDGYIDIILDFEVPLNIVDFFLSGASLDGYEQAYYVFRMISEGSLGMVSVFLKHGLIAPLKSSDGKGYNDVPYDNTSWCPFQVAMRYGQLDMVQLFLKEEEVKDATSFDFSLTSTISNGHIEMVNLMLEDGRIAINGQDLVTAVGSGKIEMVRLLLDKGDINFREGEALRKAFNDNRTEIALILLADPRLVLDKKDKEELMAIAKYNGNERLEKALRLYDVKIF